MLRSMIAAGIVLAGFTPGLARNMSASEIAKLPHDKVSSIRRHCTEKWGHQYDMRIYCEDQQYKALQTLIDRGSE